MDEKEIRIQIALGTLPTAPTRLAPIIKKADDEGLLKWALNHKSGKIRAAAVQNISLPIYDFIRYALFDRTIVVQMAVTKRLDNSDFKNTIKSLLKILSHPQLEFDFGYPEHKES